MSRIDTLRIKAKLLQKAKKNAGKSIPLKEAYDIIARSAGYPSWREMKAAVEEHAVFRPAKANLPYWNNWYSSYDEARSHLQGAGEFLLPYENQYLICGIDYIEALGISREDPDLALLGNDWAAAQDQQALNRIINKIKVSQT